MYFEELSIEEKVEATLNYFKAKDEAKIKGQEEVDKYIKRKYKGRKKASIKC
jgi:hypothetical protein